MRSCLPGKPIRVTVSAIHVVILVRAAFLAVGASSYRPLILEEGEEDMKQSRFGVVVCLLVALAAAPGLAQGPTTGTVAGDVRDNTGAVIPGVTVTASGAALLGSQVGVTGPQGQFRFPSLPPGEYKFTFELPGFATIVRDGIRIGIGFAAELHVQMNVATVQETVTVTGESPVVDTRNTTVQNNFNSEMLKNIPNARDIWSLIAEAPGMTVTRFDVGGSTAGTQTGYTAYGSSGQNRVQVEGANTTEGTSAAGFYFDYGAFEEVSFGASNAADAQMPTPGVLINTVLKSGGNEFHGDAYLDYENKSLQGDNITPALKALGAGTGQQTKAYYDPNLNLGGPIKRDKFWFFTSIRDQYIATTTSGWPLEAPGTGPNFVTKLQNATYKLTYQLNRDNKLTHYLQWGRKYQPYRDADASRTLDAVYSQNSFSWAGKVEWNHIQNSKFFFDARVSTFGYNWPNLPYTPDLSVGSGSDLRYRMYDQTSGFNAGGYYGYRYDRRRYQGELVGNMFRDNWVGGNHSLKFGWLTEKESIEDEELPSRDSLRLYFRSAAGDFATPYRVELYSDPTTYNDAMIHHGTFVQDQITVNEHLTINAGVRWDYYNAYEPEQVVRDNPYRDFFWGGVPLQTSAGPFSLPRQPFADSWTVPAKPSIIKLAANVAPRFGIAWDLAGNGRTVVKVSAGRFYYNPGVSQSSNVNPIQETIATFGWIDLNGDKLYTANELGPFVSLSGGPVNTVDPNIRNSYTDEASTFFEHQLAQNLGLRAGFVWKRQSRLWGLMDIGRPAELWTVPFTAADPGLDGVAGTADDGPPVAAYNMSRVTVSQRQWQSPEDFKQTYKNFDITLNKRMSNRWSVVASFLYTWQNESYYGGVSGNAPPQNPNEALNNLTNTSLYAFKLFGSYQAPWGILVSPVFRFQAGTPIPRRLAVSTNGGTINMLVEPSGTYRQDNVAIFDTRFEKQFRFSTSRRLGLFVDLFNINNTHAAQAQDNITGLRTVTVDGAKTTVPRFLYPTTLIAPRVMRFGVRFSF